MEADREETCAQMKKLEDNIARIETEKDRLKTQERKKDAAYFKTHFETHLAVDRAKIREPSIWYAMNAAFTAYPDLNWSKIEPHLPSATPVAPVIPVLRAQQKKKAAQEGSSSTTFTSMPPPASKP